MSETADVAERIARELERVRGLRAAAQADRKTAAARQNLRSWQAQRLARTHAALLGNPRFAEAATFFLTDLYGANDPGTRDDEVRRVLPVMLKLVPPSGLEVVADAIELDALSEELDAAMVGELGKRVVGLDAASYGRAYRQVDRRKDRERQIDLIEHLGQSLDRLARRPFISTTLALMRKPAEVAGLASLQSFLERGYAAFRKMRGAEEFLALVIAHERELLKALFAGDDRLLAA